MPQLNSSDRIGINKSNAEILSMYIKYGVFVLKYGDEQINNVGPILTLGDEHELINEIKIYVKNSFNENSEKVDFEKFKETLTTIFERNKNQLSTDDFIKSIEQHSKNSLQKYLPRTSSLNVDFPAFCYLMNKLVLNVTEKIKLSKELQIVVLEFLDDLKGKIITVAFNQFTDHIKKEKTAWWLHWQQGLAPRLNKFSIIPPEHFGLEQIDNSKKQLFGRHMYSFPNKNIFESVDNLYEANHYSSIIKHWDDALRQTYWTKKNKKYTYPLVYILKAKSSADISHFIMKFVRDFYQNNYPNQPLNQYRGCYIINTALSVEFLSALSGILNFLYTQITNSAIKPEVIQTTNRLTVLKHLLNEFGRQYQNQPKKRLLIIFTHFDTLLSERKNLYSNTVSQFIKCFELVANKFTQKKHGLGIDLVLIGNKVKMTRFVKSHLTQLYKNKSIDEINVSFSKTLNLQTKKSKDYDAAINNLIKTLSDSNQTRILVKNMIQPFKDICSRINYSYYAMMLLFGTIKFEFDSLKKETSDSVGKQEHFNEYTSWLQKTADDVSHSNTDHRSRVLIGQIIFRYTSLERKPYNPAWRLEIALRLAILRYMSAIHQPITLDVLFIAPEIKAIIEQHRAFLGRNIFRKNNEYKNNNIRTFKDLLIHKLELANKTKYNLIIDKIRTPKKPEIDDHLFIENDFYSILETVIAELPEPQNTEQKVTDQNESYFTEIKSIHQCTINELLTFIMEEAIEELEEYHFVIPIISICSAQDREKSKKRYALHRVMQEQIERIHGSKIARRGERNFYDFNCLLTAPRDMPFLDKDRYQFLMGYVDKLIELPENYEDNPGLHSSRIRAAFSIIRSHINLPVLTRVELMEDDENYDHNSNNILNEHQQRLHALTEAAKKLATLNKNFRQPLYIDETSWLYNERGMFAYAQGKFYQATPLFSLTKENNPNFQHELDVTSGEQVTHNLNQYTTMIERGALQEAYIRLTDLLEHLPKKQSFHQLACRGLLGRILYISGRLTDAEQHFEKAMKGIRKMNKIRAIALFGRQYAQLLAVKGDISKAKEILTEAIASAESTQQQDILHYCRFTEALMSIVGENVSDNDRHFALVKLEVAADYAEKMGMNELHAKACFARAQVLLATRQTKGASTIAAQGLALATKYGMTLMEAKGIVIYANIAIKSGDLETGKQLLKKGIKLAERIKYQLLVERANQSLMAIDNKVRDRAFGDFGIQLSVDSYLGF